MMPERSPVAAARDTQADDSPAAPLAPDPWDAPFDQYQRYRITEAVARAMIAGSSTATTPLALSPSALPDGRGRGGQGGVGEGSPASAAPRASLRVLDVGGHHTDFWERPRRPIAEFLPDLATVTLDVGPNPLAGYVRGRGDALPFRDRRFDLVCAVDVLEHVPATARPQLLAEMTRASSRAVLLAAPFDHPDVERAERLLAEFIRTTCGYEQGQLREHRECGLPDLDATCRELTRLGWHVRVWPYGNLWRWLLMMIDKHAISALPGSRRLQARLDRQYNERWFDDDRARPTYRHFIVATRDAQDPLLPWAEQRFGATAAGDTGVNGDGDSDVDADGRIDARGSARADESRDPIWDLLAMHAANQARQAELEPQRRDAHVAEIEAHRAVLYTHLDSVKRENARLNALLQDVEQSVTFRVLSMLRRLWPASR